MSALCKVVQSREFPEMFDRGTIVSNGGAARVTEISEINSLPEHRNPGVPSAMMWINALIGRLLCTPFRGVRVIVGNTCFAKIRATIVEAVAIPMINVWRGCMQKLSMHENTAVPDCVEGTVRFAPRCTPIPLHEPLVIGGVYDCYLTLGEWNEFDRLIERLNNWVARDAILGHDLTSNEIAVFDRILILAGD